MWPQKWKASAFCARSASEHEAAAGHGRAAARPVRARKPRREVAPATCSLSTHCRRAEQRFQLVERVEGALARAPRRRARARPRTGCRGRRATPRPRRRRARRRAGARRSGSRASSRSDGSSAVQSEQPAEVKTATASGARPSKRSISPTRPPSSGPSWSSESAACGPTASRSSPTSRASASSATASAATPTSATARPTPSQASVESEVSGRNGSTANAAARQAERTAAPQPIRERLPKHPHGWPARPRAIATTSSSVKSPSRTAAASAAPGTPAATRRRARLRARSSPPRQLSRRAHAARSSRAPVDRARRRRAWPLRSRAGPRRGRSGGDPRPTSGPGGYRQPRFRSQMVG